MLWIIACLILSPLLVLFLICLLRTWTLHSLQTPGLAAPRDTIPDHGTPDRDVSEYNTLEHRAQVVTIDKEEQIRIFAKTLTFKTIAHMYPEQFDTEPFLLLHQHLKESFPLCHSQLKFETIHELNLLYTWEGTNNTLPGILLMAHQDVVPVEQGTEQNWKYEAFSGTIADSFIWGRGALDIKNQLTGILSAVELLLKEGFQPERTVYLAFGCDEEVGGIAGTRLIAEHLAQHGTKLSYVLDEGGAIVKGMVPGIKKPVALVGIAEKGYMTLTLEAVDKGGHSSMPPAHTALGKACRAVTRIEARPFKPAIEGAVKHFIRYLAPELPFWERLILSNSWIFSRLIISIFSSSQATNALLRTTQAATMATASDKENVLPQKASIKINLRILPGDTSKTVKAHIRKVIKDKNITISDPPYSLEASKVSSPFARPFKKIQEVISSLFPEALTVPYLVLGGTDSRYYETLSENIYRFSPVLLDEQELSGMHGTNERIAIDGYCTLIKFYYALIKKTALGEQL